MRKIRKKKLKKVGNDGVAMVYVAVAAGVIILVGAAATLKVYTDLKAAEVQGVSDENFYSADGVMNAVVGGLENDISSAYGQAYSSVVARYAGAGDTEKADIELEFKNSFKSYLLAIIQAPGNTEAYSIDHLREAVEKTYTTDVSYTVTASNGLNYIVCDDNEHTVTLKNVHVTYENDNGYYDEITTDIILKTPAFSGSTPGYNVFEILADDGIEVKKYGNLTVNGDIYLGELEDADSKASFASTYDSINVYEGGKLTFNPELQVYACGNIAIGNNSTLVFNGASDTSPKTLWTENINIGRSSAFNLSGAAYVYDDLELNGDRAKAVVSGQYIGYGCSLLSAGESSSININGTSSVLDLTGLDSLLLGGTSFINAAEVVSSGSEVNSDMLLGEAIAIKSNGLSFLVNPILFQSVPGCENFKSNPMPVSTYESIKDIFTDSGAVMTASVLRDTDGAMKSYADFGAEINPVFSQADGGTVYMYLKFSDIAEANSFFTAVNSDENITDARTGEYASQYVSGDISTGSSIIKANGAVLDYSAVTLSDGTSTGSVSYTMPQNSMTPSLCEEYRAQYLGDAEDRYDIPDSLDSGKKWEHTFDKTINYDKFIEFISSARSTGATSEHITNNAMQNITNGILLKGTSDDVAILVNNENGDAYTVDKDGKGLIIATGDVKLKADWSGTIICRGRIIVDGTDGVDLTSSEADMRNTLGLYFNYDGNTYGVINVFNGYENVSVAATTETLLNANDIRNCISYDNWYSE